MSHFVRLEVVVDEVRPDELCSYDCPHGESVLRRHPEVWCHAFRGVVRTAETRELRRLPQCLAATALDEKEQAVIEAALLWNAQYKPPNERTLDEAEALHQRLEDAIDALSALRDEGGRR
jgi:hypothetical protein